jgi:perosamine synthetase
MSNIHAAIGLAQVEKADEYRNLRINNANIYKKYLNNIEEIEFQKYSNDIINVHWMNGIVYKSNKKGKDRDGLLKHLKEKNIDTRLFFIGMNKQPSLKKYGCVCEDKYPVTDYLSKNGFYLPSGSNLSEDKIFYICENIKDYLIK